MSLTLDLSKDVLIPVKVLKNFSDETYKNYSELAGQIFLHLSDKDKGIDEDKLKKDKKYSFLVEDTKEFKAFDEKFKNLHSAIQSFPDGESAWFIRSFLFLFGGNITEEARIVWDGLNSKEENRISEIDEAAKIYIRTMQDRSKKLAEACKAFQEGAVAVTDKLTEFAASLPPLGATTVTTESYSLKTTKKLYETGLISASDYQMAALLNQKILKEQTPSTTTAPPPDVAIEKEKISQWASSLKLTLEPIGSLTVGLQDAESKAASAGVGAVQESKARFIKSYIKKRILQEKREQLNEFLISLLLGALAAVFAWYTAKWATNKFNGYVVDGKVSQGQVRIEDSKTQQANVAAFVAAQNAGIGPNGQLMGADGKVVQPSTTVMNKIQYNIRNAKTNLQSLVEQANTLLAENPTKVSARVGATTQQQIASVDTIATELLNTINNHNLVTKLVTVQTAIEAIEAD
jgi:hypothetical protein